MDSGVEEFQEVVSNIMSEFISDAVDRSPQKVWPVAGDGRLVKIFRDYMKYGVVHDEKGVDIIADVFVKNTARLYVNTAMMGHTEADPADFWESFTDYPADTESDEFVDWMLQYVSGKDGQWRISDNALAYLTNEAINLLDEGIGYEDKLQIINKMLSAIHQRFDIRQLYVSNPNIVFDVLANGRVNGNN